MTVNSAVDLVAGMVAKDAEEFGGSAWVEGIALVFLAFGE